MGEIQRYRINTAGSLEKDAQGKAVLHADYLAYRAELLRLLKVFYEASSHYQNEDGNCDCEDCDKVKDALEGMK